MRNQLRTKAYLVPFHLRKALEAELSGLVNVSASIEAASQKLHLLTHAVGNDLEFHFHDLPWTTAADSTTISSMHSRVMP